MTSKSNTRTNQTISNQISLPTAQKWVKLSTEAVSHKTVSPNSVTSENWRVSMSKGLLRACAIGGKLVLSHDIVQITSLERAMTGLAEWRQSLCQQEAYTGTRENLCLLLVGVRTFIFAAQIKEGQSFYAVSDRRDELFWSNVRPVPCCSLLCTMIKSAPQDSSFIFGVKKLNGLSENRWYSDLQSLISDDLIRKTDFFHVRSHHRK